MKQFNLYRYLFLIIGAVLLYLVVNHFQDSWNFSHLIPVPSYPPFPTTDFKSLIPSSSPTEIATITPIQGTCAEGFYFYENDAYSICYPNTMEVRIDHSIPDPTTKKIQTNVTSFFSKNGEVISIVPHFAISASTNACLTKDHTTVSGFSAVRETITTSAQSKCSNTVTSVATIVDTGNTYPFYVLYYVFGDGGGKMQYATKYPYIEKSLTIKSK